MFIKVSVPGQFRLKMMPSFRSFLMHRDGEVHYIGGTDILPAHCQTVPEGYRFPRYNELPRPGASEMTGTTASFLNGTDLELKLL